jgi:methylated-DNA-[protein]-cysteine S-methyltransferase
MRRISSSSVDDGRFRGRMDSPVGVLTLVAEDGGLAAVLWDRDFAPGGAGVRFEGATDGDRHPVIVRAKRQLVEYFAGRRTEFDVPLALHGTSFQLEVWRRLLDIPYGETVSYQEQARRVGDVRKTRAVAAANGRNPISIIVPCHRVIGKNGDLTGFGGGLARKRLLLDLESKHRALQFG